MIPVPELSFVVPVFNAAPYLDDCIRSLLAQDVPVEIVAVDDGSTDSSPAILASFAARNPGVVRVFTQGNAGPGPARNRGFAEARGEVVWFVDADDAIPPRVAGALVGRLRESGADALCFGRREVTAPGRHLRAAVSVGPARRIGKEEAVLSFGPVPWGKLWRRDFLLRTGVRYPAVFGEDNVETPRLLLSAQALAAVDEACYLRRVGRAGRSGTGGVSSIAAREVDAMYAAFDEMAAGQEARWRDVLDWAGAKTAAYMEKVAEMAVRDSIGNLADAETLLAASRVRLAALLGRSEICRVALRRIARWATGRAAAESRSRLPSAWRATALFRAAARAASRLWRGVPSPPRRAGDPISALRADAERLFSAESRFPGESVSVVIPVYGEASYLRRAIDSALAQTVKPLEILVADDGSPDGAPASIARRYGPLVRYVRFPHQGVYSLRRDILREVRGRWFFNLDSDNWIEPDFLEKSLAAALDAGGGRDGAVAFVYPDRVLEGRFRGRVRVPEFDIRRFRSGNFVDMNCLVRTDCAREAGFDPAFNDGWGDYDFFLRLALAGHCGAAQHRSPLHYEVREEGLTGRAERDLFLNRIRASRMASKHLAFFGEEGATRLVRYFSPGAAARMRVVHLLREGRPVRAVSEAVRLFAAHPARCLDFLWRRRP